MATLTRSNLTKTSFVISVFLLSFLLPIKSETDQLPHITIQLNWKYQFEFAGFIAAKEKGFYRQAGLDVEFLPYEHNINTFESVLTGDADYGINISNLYLKDGEIIPTELLATYFHVSPHILVTSKAITSPNDLMGKTIMISDGIRRQSPITGLLNHFYITDDNATFVDNSYDLDDLIEGRVDAIAVYSTHEPFNLMERGFEFNIINPNDFGYGQGASHLFTSPEQAEQAPEITQKLINATNKGWEYAIANKEEIATIIIEQYNQELTLEELMFEADETEKVMLVDEVPIGTVLPGSIEQSINLLRRSGQLPSPTVSEEGLFSQEQLNYLSKKEKITYCVTPNWMPIEGIENGQHIGVTADIFNIFQQALQIPIELLLTYNWSDTLSRAKNRECDLISLANETKPRLAYLDFTTPYLSFPLVMATRVDTTLFIPDIKQIKPHQKIGIVANYATAEKLRKEVPDVNIVAVPSMETGLAMVERGELFGYVDNLMAMSTSLQQEYNGSLKVSARLNIKSLNSVATRNDEPLLGEIFEILVSNLSSEDIQTSFNKWLAVEQTEVINYSLIWKILIIGFVITGFFIYYYLKLKRLKDELLVLSVTDKLTGLYNRSKLDKVIAEKKAELDRYGSPVSAILLDIDHFKHINDNFGHLTGDNVLIEFASILKNNIRATDYICRWGGEEFLILCPNIDINAASELAEKLLKKVRTHSFDEVGHLTASAGVNKFTKNSSALNTIRNVDKALYHSKNSGRDRVSVASDY